jgi:hypothetical protein
VAWPLNAPLLALAYKIRQGGQKIDMEPGEFWWRTTLGTLGMGLGSLVLLGLVWFLVARTELQAGIFHLVLFMVYLPAAVWFVFWIYALEDLLQGLSVFSLYILLPALPLVLLGRLFGLWRWLRDVAPWLLPPA